ncbi:MAG TPA: protein phosphatase 2C domain-containing protein [Caulobacteraceae bacterium]|nr:protein phosphatase 2C domain-containing protein [Caulobacteraceae bacterium]
MSAAFRIKSAGVTHEGRKRDHNEDALLLREGEGAWAVADGMGGHENGEWASSAIVEALRAAPLGEDFDRSVAALAEAIHTANGHIYRTALAGNVRMGSTVVALLIGDERFACLWAGDSRIYLLRGGVLHRLTQDHTRVQDLIEAGMLTPDEAKGHPMSHVLSRAVGVQAELELDAVSDKVAHNDVFLLCSDGLTGPVSEPEIADCMSAPPSEACRRLLELTLDRGAPDNVTVAVIACEEMTALSFAAADRGLG